MNTKKLLWSVSFAIYAGLVLYGSVVPVRDGPPIISVPGTDKLLHAGEFTIFVLILNPTLYYYSRDIERTRLALVAISMLYGGFAELVQVFVASRTPSLLDWGANAAGIFIGLAAISLMKEWRKRKL